MQIKILGTRGEIKPSVRLHSKHSGILIDNKLLFDVGEKEFLKYKPKYIFITHLHPDHAYFVRTGIYSDIKSQLFAPEKFKNYKITILKKTKKINDYEITPIPTHHSLKVLSQAYLIKKDKTKILYTGDMIWIDKKYQKKLRNLDLVITEASYYRKKGLIIRDAKTGKLYGHAGVPDLLKLFSKYTKTILLVHFGSWFYKNIKYSSKKLKKLEKEHDIKVYIGFDGAILNTSKL